MRLAPQGASRIRSRTGGAPLALTGLFLTPGSTSMPALSRSIKGLALLFLATACDARENGLGDRVTSVCMNLLSSFAPRPMFDVILSSPPKHAPMTFTGPARGARPLARQSRDKIIDREIDRRLLTAAVYPDQRALR